MPGNQTLQPSSDHFACSFFPSGFPPPPIIWVVFLSLSWRCCIKRPMEEQRDNIG